MKHLKAPIMAIVAVLTGAAPVLAQEVDPRPTLTDLFTADRVATFVANTVITAIRTRMELEYDHMSADPMRGVVSMSGIVARPLLPYDQARQCEITIDRATLNGDIVNPGAPISEVNLNLIGARATLACLERDVALMLRTAGYKHIPLDQFKVRVGYVYTTGETHVDTSIAVNGFGVFDFTGSGTILPRLGEFGYPGDPAVRVTRAVASLKDDGGWAATAAILPENLRDPATIRALGTEAVSQFMSDGGLRPLGAVERNFIAQLMDKVEAFVADPGEITLEADLPPTGIVIEPDMFDDPQSLITGLALQARTAPVARSQILPVAMLEQVQNPEGLSDAERLALATALIDGTGVPRSNTFVPELLTPLLDTPATAGPAAVLLARAVADSDVQAAYEYALIAAATAMPGAPAQLDRLEAQMTTRAVMAAQQVYLDASQAADPVTQITGEDPRDLRALALAHFTGSGAPRSYARAYYFALLAEAAGDIGAETLRTDIAARFAGRGDAVAQAWQTTRTQIEAQALTDWIAADLPARYLSE